jgi:hypothetical protein
LDIPLSASPDQLEQQIEIAGQQSNGSPSVIENHESGIEKMLGKCFDEVSQSCLFSNRNGKARFRNEPPF